MALEEKRNNVRFQGRDDYVVVYFDVQEGDNKGQYFFLDEGKDRLKNGNIIATTNLRVAIGATKPEELCDIGVISPEGKIVIPFENRKIKVLTDNILLAEPAKPVSENVIKALEDRSNPTEATRLVNAVNTIKGKVSNSVGPDGKFVLNDLCLEGTIYDIDGNNLVDGKYFSFIAMNDNTLCLSTNDPESELVTLPLNEEVKEEVSNVEEEALPSENIDVSEVKVDESVVEDAFKEQEAPVDETIVQEEPVEDEEVATATEEPLVNVEESTEEASTEDTEEKTSEEEPNALKDEVVEDSSPEENKEEEKSESEETVAEEDSIKDASEEETKDEETKEDLEDIEDKTLTDLVSFTPEDDLDETLPELDESDFEDDNRFDSSKVKVDSIKDYDHFDIDDKDFLSTDIAEGTAIVEKMINKFKEQDSKIASLERQLLEQRDSNRAIVRKAKEQEEKLNALASENDKLEEKASYYKRVASSAVEENNKLKGQLEDKDKLLYMLKEAQKLLNGDNDLDYNAYDDNFYGKVA